MGELIPILRAAKPSKKSKIMAIMSNSAPISILPKKLIIIAKTPHVKFEAVNRLGRLNNFILFWLILSEGNLKIAYIYADYFSLHNK